MKLAVNIGLSLAMLGICVWLVWPDAATQSRMAAAFDQLTWSGFAPYLAGHLALLAVTHFCRAWRWYYSLAPLKVRPEPLRLLAVSSVGFMAILALPARLGEFVRPALLRRKGEVSASAALGTIAVERVVDGLLISLFVFFTFFLHRDSEFARPWMMKAAWGALGIFSAATVFLAFALRWPERTVRFAVTMTMARRFAPRVARVLEEKLLSMISGFLILKDGRNLVGFVFWSVLYWGANGLSLWVLALAFDLDLPLVGAYATMGIIAVGIILPNSPGLVGQYQYLCILGLSLYMPEAIARSDGLAFAIVLHGLQVVWYIGIGALALASPYVSFREAFRRSDAELDPDA